MIPGILVLALALAAPAEPTAAATPVRASAQTVEAEPLATTTVGMRVRLSELPLAGSQLRARPVADAGEAAALVRIINVFPHGESFRYNLEVTPFVSGVLDLRDHLERVDGSGLDELPPLPIEVSAVLAPDELLPNDLAPTQAPSVGGYGTKVVIAVVLWVAGLLALLFVGRARRVARAEAQDAPPPTLAERLRPLVERARDGDLPDGERARLERLLLAHWRERRPDLARAGVADAVARLRRDPEAGPLFQALERWLHSPSGGAGDVDVSALLEPYRRAVDPAPHEEAQVP